MLGRYFSIALAALAVGAQAQLTANPNIEVPASSMPQPAGFMRTHYYRLIGPWLGREPQNYPVLALHGPALLTQPQGFSPAEVRTAYNLPSAGGSGAIAVVDAFDLPTALNDFNVFAKQFGLPMETSTSVTASTNKVFQVVYAAGSQPTGNADWGGEMALDMEWAHAMAPNAKIYLVEAASSSGSDLFAAAKLAGTLPGVKEVSMSWGGSEFAGEATYDSYFQNPGVVYFASAGDTGSAQGYPAESANVVGVGGTSLQLNGTAVSETAWKDGGGGPSSQILRPSYQNGVQSVVGAARGCPDVSFLADPNTGVAIYDSYGAPGWFVVGGTSLSSPAVAGVTNLRGKFNASTAAELAQIYQFYGSSLYRDITQGSSGKYSAMKGYDFCTGIGSPVGLLPSIKSISLDKTTVTGGTTVHLTATLPAALSQAVTVTVTSSVPSIVPNPTAITIAAGQTSGSTSVPTDAFVGLTNEPVTLSASLYGSALSTVLTVEPTSAHLKIIELSLAPGSVTGGAPASLTVYFAQASISTDSLTVGTSNATIVPAITSVSVPAGKTSIVVPIKTVFFTTGAKLAVTLTAKTATNSASDVLEVLPFQVSSLKVTHSTIVEGDSQGITVTMSAAAPAAETVTVTSNNTATVPSVAVTIPAGSLTGTATVTSVRTYLSAAKAVTWSTSEGPAQAVGFTVEPLVTTFAVSPASIIGGSSTGTTATITFYRAIGTAGTVTLPPVSGLTFPATAPAYSATATSVTFKVTAAKVTAQKVYTLTAKVAGYTRTCTLTVIP